MNDPNKIKTIALEAAAAFVKNYKCPLDQATDFFYERITKNQEITKLIQTAPTAKQLSKNAAFKEFIKKNKKDLYYKLRKYKSNESHLAELMQALTDVKTNEATASPHELLEKLSQVHVSSQERFAENEAFYTELSGTIGSAVTIVDVGCGVQPLFFPKEQFPLVAKYVALDKDRESVSIMQRFKEAFTTRYDWLYPRVWNIAEGWGDICKTFEVEVFDAALVLKVVPVVKRIEPLLLDGLVKIPAEMIIVSGVKESMVRKHDIEHKERRAINSFIQTSGREVVKQFELENEFFIIIT